MKRLFLFVSLLLIPGQSHALCPLLVGDLTGDAQVTATDVQCAALGALAAVQTGEVPSCVDGVPCSIDPTCDGYLTALDVAVTAQLALGSALPPSWDANGDQCPDACEVTDVGDPCMACTGIATANCQAWRWNGAECAPAETVDCDDCNPCTQDVCHAGLTCEHTPTNEGLPCVDFNACTATDTCVEGTCRGELTTSQPSPDCPDTTGPACWISGVDGNTAYCPLRASRLTETTGTTALLAELRFDATKLRLLGVGNGTCEGDDCAFEPIVDALPATLSGHELLIDPESASDWNGQPCATDATCSGGTSCINQICEGTGGLGTILLLHPTDDFVPLSNSTLVGYGLGPCLDPDAGDPTVTGEPTYLVLQFLLKQTIPGTSAEPVHHDQVIAEGPGGMPLAFRIADAIIISQ